MLKTLIIGRGLAVRDWAEALRASGFDVQAEPDRAALGYWIDNARFELAVIDISSAEGEEGAVIPVLREAWPGCRFIAMVTAHGFNAAGVHRMGVWCPDQVLVKPVAPALLSGTARLLAARTVPA